MWISCNNLHENREEIWAVWRRVNPGAAQNRRKWIEAIVKPLTMLETCTVSGFLLPYLQIWGIQEVFYCGQSQMRPAHKQKNPTISNVKSLDLWSEWRESNSRPLEPHCAWAMNTMSQMTLTVRSITKFRSHYTIPSRLMSRCFVPFVVKLWSTRPDKWLFPPYQVTSRNFDFLKSMLRFFVCTNYS